MLKVYLTNHATEIGFVIIFLISVIAGVFVYLYEKHKRTKVSGNRINYNTTESGEYHGFYAYSSDVKSRKSDSKSSSYDSNSSSSSSSYSNSSSSSSSYSNSTASYSDSGGSSDSGSSCDSGSSSSSCE